MRSRATPGAVSLSHTASAEKRLPAVDRFGEIHVDYAAHQVSREEQPVELHPKEYELLVALLRRGGAIASRDELLREVWGYAVGVTSRNGRHARWSAAQAARARSFPAPIHPDGSAVRLPS